MLYSPTPTYSDADKRLLSLLAKLILENNELPRSVSNLSQGFVVLTDSEAEELTKNLEVLVSSRRFVEACYFVESITRVEEEARAREIFLSNRTKSGRTRVMSSRFWADFQTRLGIDNSGVRLVATKAMPLEYFHKMERRLLLACGLSPRVVDIVMTAVSEQNDFLRQVREDKRRLNRGIIRQGIFEPILAWTKKFTPLPDRELSRERVIGAITIIADFSVIFTTRDWGVTGTLSTMAGAAAAAVAP